ncbi:hypothetical protein AAG570_008897 [Ranatra chinensis]|uniref:Cyclin-like domain-containing protein n=1 Tax=Ranatra chinensis TaxID=642074 RepID=A0ABD0YSJ6_9HEMI
MERLDPDYISRHPSLQSYFRAVLLDWIIEVCDLYNLNRETYYMTVDYIDRYLTLSSGHPRSELQLLGITSLFVASKIEEIDPPPLADLVYIADDSFSAKDIVEMEYKLLEIVGWSHTKWTANKWLNLYLHMTGLQIGRCEFSLMTRLLDLSSLDVHCLSFSNRILGATCLRLAVQQSLPAGLLPLLPDITSCSEWMAVYWEVIQNSSEDMYQGSKRVYFNQCKVFRNLELNHKYTSYISLYEKGQELIKDETVLPLFTFSAEAVYSQ